MLMHSSNESKGLDDVPLYQDDDNEIMFKLLFYSASFFQNLCFMEHKSRMELIVTFFPFSPEAVLKRGLVLHTAHLKFHRRDDT